jgi:hypothetical protein
MGANSRERHKAKKKTRARRDSDRSRSGHSNVYYCDDCGEFHVGTARPSRPRPADLADELVQTAAKAIRDNDSEALATCLDLLARDDDPQWRLTIENALVTTFVQYVQAAWSNGWQPRDLVRIVERDLGARPGLMIRDLIAGERIEYATATVSESWDAQLTTLGASVWWPSAGSYLAAFAAREGIEHMAVLRCALDVLGQLRRLPRIAVLGPVPGQARRGSLGPAGASSNAPDPRMLDKVRALLAKAESTEYEEEADSLTAKAQELMTRHSIDYTLLAATTDTRQQPQGIRIGIDNPYEDAKAVLLQQVAESNGCQSVFSKHLGFVTVVGFAGDLAAAEVLFTSLLVQATAAMMRAGSRVDSSGRSRTRSFRQSFLYAYAVRIGQRLRDAADETGKTAAQERGVALVPVLTAKREAVGEAFKSLVGQVEFKAFAIANHEGWISGTAAADLSNVNIREGLSPT